MVKILVILLVIMTGLVPVAFTQTLGTDCEPYGSISQKGQPVENNLPVVAYINNQPMARCLTNGGQYSLVIPLDNPDTPEKDGWSAGDIITIRVNGSETYPSLTASPGRIRHDLQVSTLDVQLDTWGKIKALFQ